MFSANSSPKLSIMRSKSTDLSGDERLQWHLFKVGQFYALGGASFGDRANSGGATKRFGQRHAGIVANC